AYENQTTPTCPATTTLFVDQNATGNNSGDDWPNAQPDLALALSDAARCDVEEVWVATGTYLPGSERADSFHLAPSVAVYGGFAGNETERDERNWVSNPTILSGDIGTPNDTSDNSYHVVYAEGAAGTVITSTTIIDGFTLTKGTADGPGLNSMGGGIFCNGIGSGNECSPSLSNLIFQENTASFWGGGIYNQGEGGISSPSLTNVVFYNNTADRGAGIYNYGYNGISSPSLTNVTFFGNTANRGGGMYNYGFNGDSSPLLTNVILWRDSGIGPEIYNLDAYPTVSYSLLMGGLEHISNGGASMVIDGGNNLDLSPKFEDATNGDLRLQDGSPAIDRGDDSAPGLSGIATDLDGNPRFADWYGDNINIIDMGAYENQTTLYCPSTATIYVDHYASGNNSGDDWPNAQSDLAVALALAANCDVNEIWVAEGTYYPGNDRADRFNIVPGVAVYGGFEGDETEFDDRDWIAHPTILSGDIGTPNDNSDNSYHVVYADGTTGIPIEASTILDGFTITAGNANVDYPDNQGGGYYCNGVGSNSQCNPNLTNITFLNNSASGGGALINDGYNNGNSSPSLLNVNFFDNSAFTGGAMINYSYLGTSSPNLTNVIFSGNTAVSGGAIHNSFLLGNSNPSLINVTFSNNIADYEGGAISNEGDYGSSGTNNIRLSNVIMWGNSSPNGNQIYNLDATVSITNSLIQGGIAGIYNEGISNVIDGGNNIDSDPLFIDAANENLRLQTGSPAIDAGDDVVCPAADLDGVIRPLGTACDMGAYEFWGLAITAVSAIDAELAWQDPMTSCTYDVFENSEPYFTPATPTYLNVTSAHPLNGRLGDPLTNYFFINRATCAGGTMVYSNTVGEFDFALVPGSE
ncbi:MAG: hypothetical protein KDE48_17425, partial [Anaerolineales bacterium]|nr:hypothetical protein [Anaerolineales bacterium]